MFKPDFSKLSGDAVLEALGHAFFTLSLGMGAMVTYGSYLKSERHVVRDGVAVAALDTVIALLAGVVIFAVVFAHGHDPAAGPGLVFKTLPSLFVTMKGGAVLAAVFFLLLVFAAWSSAVSLLEVVVSWLVDQRGWNRRAATCTSGGVIWALGLASVVTLTSENSNIADYGRELYASVAGSGGLTGLAEFVRTNPPNVLDMLDDVTTRYMLPLGGLLIALAAGWLLSRDDRRAGFESLGSAGRLLSPVWTGLIRFVTPVLVLAVILHKLELLDGILAVIGLG